MSNHLEQIKLAPSQVCLYVLESIFSNWPHNLTLLFCASATMNERQENLKESRKDGKWGTLVAKEFLGEKVQRAGKLTSA